MIITREHLEWFAPALREQALDFGRVPTTIFARNAFQLSITEASAGMVELLSDTADKLDDITLGQNFRKAIEAADGRKFEAGS